MDISPTLTVRSEPGGGIAQQKTVMPNRPAAEDISCIAVAVFAHNEEANILNCLDGLPNGSVSRPVHAYVLANGCSDNTEALVRNYQERHPWVTLIASRTGDKANTWNTYVHETLGDVSAAFFIDGDVQVGPHAFDHLLAQLNAQPDALAAAAVPATGRHKEQMKSLVCDRHLILGNLYALRGDFLRRVKWVGARLPVGYIGEDGLITSLVKWNLDPGGPFLDRRVAPCPTAQFSYRPLSFLSHRDLRLYLRRRVRYSMRHFQHALLVPLLQAHGLSGLPATVEELYRVQHTSLKALRPRLGTDVAFDMAALAKMRRASSE